jgi:hypothetical protein
VLCCSSPAAAAADDGAATNLLGVDSLASTARLAFEHVANALDIVCTWIYIETPAPRSRGTTTRWPTTSRRRSNRCVEPWCGMRRLVEVVVDGDVEPLLYYDGGAESRCGDWTVDAWAGPRAARSSRAARPGATRR